MTVEVPSRDAGNGVRGLIVLIRVNIMRLFLTFAVANAQNARSSKAECLEL